VDKLLADSFKTLLGYHRTVVPKLFRRDSRPKPKTSEKWILHA